MSYLVLARKWRPKSFDTLVGQDHVVRALTHALTTQRLHHAWLFTGTRGVGKTTLSRILAKSLNCETGITARPCGQCRACTEIDAGRFVDYVELDAASNRGVDEMTQLLEQAAYAPSAARFKVYMIDEVHMLSGHAFNAMLKTLEEPPPYVKFILATTDPQKIPPTVLSRCLQFNLKQMSAEGIVGHLGHVLAEEGIAYEAPALWLLAQAAGGSMRDALSLTDQAIAYSAGSLSDEAVRGMLGTIDQRHLVRLLDALLAQDGGAMLGVADELAVRGLSYAGALADLAVLLSRLAVAQRVPAAVSDEDPLAADVRRLAQQMDADAIQLFYTVAVHGRGELALAPDEYAGFVMTLLRMLSLVASAGGAAASNGAPPLVTPSPAPSVAEAPPVVAPVSEPSRPVAPAAPAMPAPAASEPEPEPAPEAAPAAPAATAPAPVPAPAPAAPVAAERVEPVAPVAPVAAPVVTPAPVARPEAVLAPAPPDEDMPPWDMDIPDFPPDGEDWQPADPAPPARPAEAPLRSPTPGVIALTQPWHELAARLPVTGLASELARHSEWLGVHGQTVQLRVAARTLSEVSGRERLRQCLEEYFDCTVRLDVLVAETGDETAYAVDEAVRVERQQAAEAAVDADPFVQTLVQDFDARVQPGSVRAITPEAGGAA